MTKKWTALSAITKPTGINPTTIPAIMEQVGATTPAFNQLTGRQHEQRTCSFMGLEEAQRYLKCIGPRGRSIMDQITGKRSATDIRLQFRKEHANVACVKRLASHIKGVFEKRGTGRRLIMNLYSTEKLYILLSAMGPEERNAIDSSHTCKCVRIRSVVIENVFAAARKLALVP